MSTFRVPCLLTAALFGCTSTTGTSGGATPVVADAVADAGSGSPSDTATATDTGPGTDGDTAAQDTDSTSGQTTTTLTGTLGKLGKVLPTVSSLMISNSGETLIYMSSAPITCDMLTVSHWLKSAEAGSQVVEIVLPGNPKVGKIKVPPGEVNYAAGGKSSSYEVGADSGTIEFTQVGVKNVVEGTVSATYGKDSISGTFHATFCDGGQGY